MINSFRGLLLFGALYCATQGALDSWDEAYELPYLADSGVSVSAISIAQTFGVFPMIIKGLLCVPSDVLRMRRPFVAFGLILSGVVFFSQSGFNPLSQYGLYIFCLMLRNTGAAISDGASDGLTIDADVDALSGTLSAWQGVGRMSGLIVSTLAGAQIANKTFAGLLMFLGAWMLFSAPVVLLVKEELPPSPLGVRISAACSHALNMATCGAFDRMMVRAAQRAKLRSSAGAESPDGGGVFSTVVANPLRSARALGASFWGGTSPYSSDGSEAVLPSDVVFHSPLQRGNVLPPPAAVEVGANLAPALALAGGETMLPVAVNVMTAAVSTELRDEVPHPLEGDGSSTTVSDEGPQPTPETVVEGDGSSPFRPPLKITVPSGDEGAPSTPAPDAAGASSGEAAGSPQLTASEAFYVLLRHVRRLPVAAFVIFMFAAQLATYIASFPVVLWLQEQKGFSLEEVGYLTVIGAFGNMAGCYVAGVSFDTVSSKRLALATATLLSTFPYLLFLITPNKASVYVVWVLCSVGYGALYTVQTGMLRLLADAAVAASYSGLCMGMLAAAAAAGTYIGGIIAEGDAGGYEACYKAGAYTSVGALLTIPWITVADPDIEEFKAKQRAERVKAAGGKVRRRSSFVEWVGALRGTSVRDALVASDVATERVIAGEKAAAVIAAKAKRGNADANIFTDADVDAVVDADADVDADDNVDANAGAETQPESWHLLPKLRKPTLGSMANLLDARRDAAAPESLVARARGWVRTLFTDQSRRSLRRKNTDWGGAGVLASPRE